MQKFALDAVWKRTQGGTKGIFSARYKVETIVREIHKSQNRKSLLRALLVLWICETDSKGSPAIKKPGEKR